MMLLEGVRVLDVTRYVAGPMCTALLADLGAEVIRIEPPGGGEDRTPLPIEDGFHAGAGFTQVMRNKRCLSLDLSKHEGQAVFDKLLASADIVAANLPLATVQQLGLSYERLCSVKPDIIFLHLTTFGTQGPYVNRVGFDAIAQVMSGITHLSGEPGKPMKSAAAYVDMSSGYLAAFGLMAALRHRDRTGVGQQVAVNLLQTAISISNYFLIEEDFNAYRRSGTGNRAQSGGPADLIPTADGGVYMVALGNPMFKRWARAIGREDLVSDPRFQSDESRAEHGEALSAIATEWAASKTTQEVLAILEKNKIPAGPLLSPREVLDDPHVRQCFLQDVPVEGLPKPVPYVRPPVHFSKTPGRICSGPPKPGADTEAVLTEAGFNTAQIDALRAAGTV